MPIVHVEDLWGKAVRAPIDEEDETVLDTLVYLTDEQLTYVKENIGVSVMVQALLLGGVSKQ